MTIESEITRIKTNIDNAYAALEAKGAAIPNEKNSANLVSTVNTITTEDSVSPLEITNEGELKKRSQPFNLAFPTVTFINFRGAAYTFYECDGLTSVDLSNLQQVGHEGLRSAFEQCRNLNSVNLSSLQMIDSDGLNSAFKSCTSLTSLSFPALNEASFDFLGYLDWFTDMLSGVTGCTVHFPANVERFMSSLDDTKRGFGGYKTTVLFDLDITGAIVNFISDKNLLCYVDDILLDGTSGYVRAPGGLYACYNKDDNIILFSRYSAGIGETVNITPNFAQEYHTLFLNLGIPGAIVMASPIEPEGNSLYMTGFLLEETDNGLYILNFIKTTGGASRVYYAAVKPDYSAYTIGEAVLTDKDVTINDFTWVSAGG